MNRKLWTQLIHKRSCPEWLCPVCQSRLGIVKNSLVHHETVESKDSRFRLGDEFNYHDISYIFTAWAECKNPNCKQRVAISGNGGVDLESNADGEPEYVEYFMPLVCNPMPDIIEFPKSCPKNIKEKLRAAFSIFWVHRDACAGRIRVSLEYLMDHFNIPRQDTNKKV
ncbi:MAG: hypothetical protein ACKN9T_03855 [Candidatus Methylumidiphilus sp.]